MLTKTRDEDRIFKSRRTTEPGKRNLATRIAVTHVRKAVLHKGVNLIDIAQMYYPEDELLQRAVSGPAMLSNPAWAGVLGQTVTADLLEGLSPHSAAADIMRLGLQLSFDRAAAISVPHYVANDVTAAKFVADGDPIPVYAGSLKIPAQVVPHKIAGIFVLTREMIESSNAERIIGDMMLRSMGETLDQYFFDANPAGADRPAGIRNGVSTTPASSASDFEQAALGDLGALADATGNVSGNSPLAFVAAPGRAMMARVRLFGQEDYVQIFSSSTSDFTTNHILVSVACDGIVAAISPEPDIETSSGSSLHMDTVPKEIVKGDGTQAAPVRSLFQTDSMAMKIRWPVSWTVRDPRAVAWTTPTGW